MSLAVAVLAVGLVVGWLAGGSLARLGDLPLRAPGLVVAALVVQLGGTLVGGPVHPAALVVSAGLVVVFLSRNRLLPGVPLVAVGLLLNAVVAVANGAMPVSQDAAARAGAALGPLVAGDDPRHELSGAATRLPLLGDVVPVPLPLRAEVVSPGDVLVTAGLAQLVVAGMLRRRRVALASPVGAP